MSMDIRGEPLMTRLPLIGGRACLDFANTLFWRLRQEPTEALTGYDELLVFRACCKTA